MQPNYQSADELVCAESGQGSVEAAFVIPVLFVALLLLIQPGILLYDRMVMQAAASEGCRLLATKTDVQGSMDESCEVYIRHRLASIPPENCFHVHDGDCSWEIELLGDETSPEVTVTIRNQVKPLPLFDGAATVLNLVNSEGNIVLEVSCSAPTQPHWVHEGPLGSNPAGWIGAWIEDV